MARYHNNQSYYLDLLFDFPFHLFLFILVLLSIMSLSWYINYDHMVEGMTAQAKFLLIMCPVLLLLALHFLSSSDRRRVPLIMALPERKESIHQAGGSPLGVALLLMLLLYLISHQSSFHRRWFPLITR